MMRTLCSLGLAGLWILGGCVATEVTEPELGAEEFVADGGASAADDEVTATEQDLQATTYIGVVGGYSTSCYGSVPRPIYRCSAYQVSVYKSGSKTCSKKRSGNYAVYSGFSATTAWGTPFCSG